MFLDDNKTRIAENFIYMRALFEQIPQIHEIERRCFSDPWSEESFKNELKDDLARYFTAVKLTSAGKKSDNVAGFCGYWSIVGEAHITNVAVHPDYRERGVGAGLVYAMLCDIVVLGHKSATLEVRVDNYPAIRLYERFGFTRAGIRKKYYDNGKKDALIMWLYFDT